MEGRKLTGEQSSTGSMHRWYGLVHMFGSHVSDKVHVYLNLQAGFHGGAHGADGLEG